MTDPTPRETGTPGAFDPPDADRARARQLVIDALEAAGLAADVVGEHRVMTMLSGEWKRTIPVMLDVEERSLVVTSLFAGVPDEGHLEVYRLLLQRNQRAHAVHFALDDEGDLILTGRVPLAALDEQRFDELLGELLSVSDATFNRVLRTGFATYLGHEQRWRAGAGMPANPVGEPITSDGPDGSRQ